MVRFGQDTFDAASADAAVLDASPVDAPPGADSQPVDVLVDSAPVDSATCTLGALRCSTAGGRQACKAAGWVAAPCPAITPTCVDGACKVCAPNATYCAEAAAGQQAKTVLKCNAVGDAAAVLSQCPDGPCEGGQCLVCASGTHRCVDGKREVCAGGGILWAPDHCPDTTPVCSDGKCGDCAPGQKLCATDANGASIVTQCGAPGTTPTAVQTCQGDMFCVAGVCVVCKPGAKKCMDGQAAACANDGSGWSTSPCAKDTPVCADGVCLVCAPDKPFCVQGPGGQSSAVMKCDATGLSAKIVAPCGGGEICQQGACKVCVSGTATCLGDVPLICDVAEKSLVIGASCSLGGLKCTAAGCACPANATFCGPPPAGVLQGTAVMKCSATGKSANKLAACVGDQRCIDGACAACKPGQARCGGDLQLQCKVDGSGWQVKEPCAPTGLPCVDGACVDICKLPSGNKTHFGCEFWAVDLDNAKVTGGGSALDAHNAPYGVMLINDGSKAASVTITLAPSATVPTAKTYTISVPAGSSQTLTLPPPSWSIGPHHPDGTTDATRAYRITATAPIAVVQHNPLQSSAFSADASLLLPVNGLGSDHLVIGRKQSNAELRSFIAVVAATDGITKITVTTSAATVAGKGIPAMKPGDSRSFSLVHGQVLNLETSAVGDDFSGTRISADKPIALFSGAEAANAPDTDSCITTPSGTKACAGTAKPCAVNGDCPQTCCADHIEEQLPPIETWGKTHIAGRLQPRGKEPDTWRIVAAYAGTRVLTQPAAIPLTLLGAGEWLEFTTDKDLVILADKPVLVGQFMASSGLTGTQLGDPAFVVATPVERLGREVRLVVPSTFPSNYLTIAAPKGTQVKLDDTVLGAGTEIAGTGWTVLRTPVSPGNRTVRASEPIAVTVHGWSKDGSYAHPGGFGWR